MRTAKTTLCMLLAAAIGSAATATSIWETQRKAGPLRPDQSQTIPDQETERDYISISIIPLQLYKEFKTDKDEHLLLDAAKKAAGETSYIPAELNDGTPYTFTTRRAKELFEIAGSRILANSRPGEPLSELIDKELDKAGAEGLALDGSRIIDYPAALRLAETAQRAGLEGYHRKIEEGRKKFPPHTSQEYSKIPNERCEAKEYLITEQDARAARTVFVRTNWYHIEDRATPACESHGHIFEKIEGKRIGYTTELAQDLYHRAIASLSAEREGSAASHHDRVRHALEISVDPAIFETTRLKDGTPIIDFKHAGDLIDFAHEAKEKAYFNGPRR